MNITSILKTKYPENFIGGECGTWAHNIVDFPSVGDSYAQKKKAVQTFGILKENLQLYHIGDILICSDGTFMGYGNGHVCVVVDVQNGIPIVGESNFKKDGLVHYGRKVDLSKVYGVIRGKFKFALPTDTVINLDIFMQYPKQWDSKVFIELSDWFKKGGITLNIRPLYTYGSLKNWWYKIYDQYFETVDLGFIKDQAFPLRQPNSSFLLWSINRQQWQGRLFNQIGDECGYYYAYENPGVAIIICEEGEQSPFNSGISSFADYARHEIVHWLYSIGRTDQRDMCHDRFFGQNGSEKNFDLVFQDLDFDRLKINL